MLRIARGKRTLHDADWRVVAVRLKRRVPIFGSVGLRAVRRLTPKAEAPRARTIAAIRGRRRLGRAIGISALLVLGVAVWMALGARAFSCLQQPCLPNGFRGHVAALEFARTATDVRAIVGDAGNPNREVMWKELNRDFIFIAFYLVLYLLLAAALARGASRFSPLLTGIAVVAAISTAGFDVLENVRALKVLSIPLATLDDATVAGILDASVIKWTFSFVTIAILALAFHHRNRLSNTLRALFILTALAGLVGLIWHPLMGLSLIPLMIGLLVLIFTGLFRPLRLIRDS